MKDYGYTELDGFPERFKKIREATKKTLKEVCEPTGMGQEVAYRIEHSRGHNPTIYTLLRLAEGLEVNVHALLSDEIADRVCESYEMENNE